MNETGKSRAIGNVGEPEPGGVPRGGESIQCALRPDPYEKLATELSETRAALAGSVQELQAAARQIATLEHTNKRRRGELKHLVQREAQARVFGYHDELTGLANRRLLKDRLNQALARAGRENLNVALILLDLDDFKRINDELGHPVGDQVLRVVAARLVAGTRGADTACRYGGDEFVIMLPQVDDVRMADAVTNKLKAALAAPIVVENCGIRVSASAGRVFYPDDGVTCAELIDVADQRLYRAKASRTIVAFNRPPVRMLGH